MNVSLRRVVPADREFLLRVYAGTRQQELALTGWSDDERERFVRMQFEAQWAHYTRCWPAAEQSVIEVAELTIAPAGRLWVDRRADALHVLDIALLPAWRRRGIGTSCLRGLMDEAAAAGLPLTIFVEQQNPARRLYDRLGFVAVGPLEGFHQRMAWQAEPAVHGPAEESCDEQA